jgi:HK97 family phage prohead protease
MMDRAQVPFEVKFATDAPPGTFEGYGSVFGNEDSYGDVIQKGAFKNSLAEWKSQNRMPKMLLQHGGGFLGGSSLDMSPIGVWQDMHEDTKGLVCKGQLFAIDTERGTYIHEGLKSGALDGLSIGFMAKEWERGTKPTEPARTLKKVDLMEVSVVTFPANGRALISDVKNLEELKSLADCERWMRDASGCSRKEALAFVSTVRRIAQRDAAASKVPDLKSALKQALEAFG